MSLWLGIVFYWSSHKHLLSNHPRDKIWRLIETGTTVRLRYLVFSTHARPSLPIFLMIFNLRNDKHISLGRVGSSSLMKNGMDTRCLASSDCNALCNHWHLLNTIIILCKLQYFRVPIGVSSHLSEILNIGVLVRPQLFQDRLYPGQNQLAILVP